MMRLNKEKRSFLDKLRLRRSKTSRGQDEMALRKIESDWNRFNEASINISPSTDELFEKIRAKTIYGIGPASGETRSAHKWWLKAAAGVAILALMLPASNLLKRDASLDNLNPITRRTNGPGERSTFFLPDGSKIMLNAESSVVFSPNFSSECREITLLKGEAYFTVAHNERPFIVKAGGITTKTFSSSFAVQASEGNSTEVKIAVEKGEAEIKADETLEKEKTPKVLPLIKLLPPIAVRQKEMLVYHQDTRTVEKISDYDPKEVMGWKDGIIYFKEANCAEIENKLTKWYGVDVEIEPAICANGNFSFTGEFVDAGLDDVLERIVASAKVRSKNESSN